ncbi:hypothetical protein [Streptomyces lonegramiae]|uniref:ATP-grasp target RiPP n=1 Tax=Streptomyces lonegramiae TaxID=3075524 RepID=A0ABU2XE51_9ACTN|nr:hypothetical protein [Streptomyces sp. DSM 41529]MDT0543825.1 hypothetical protein [Streptomyces sp. DSM 41529]
MSAAAVDKYETRTPDAEGWHGVPFRHPHDLATAQADGRKHDGGPTPPEAPRDPDPQGGDGK